MLISSSKTPEFGAVSDIVPVGFIFTSSDPRIISISTVEARMESIPLDDVSASESSTLTYTVRSCLPSDASPWVGKSVSVSGLSPIGTG